MGNDGGSIPTRRELVKSPTRTKTTSELRTASSDNSSYHWTYCPLSKRPLEKTSIVSDSLGRLFNKDAVLEWLINPEAFGDGEEVMKVASVKGLKDLVDVKFEVDKVDTVEGNGNGEKKEIWVCPVTKKELGPGSHAVYLVPCGHVFAESAVKEIKEEVCLVCSEPFTKNNVIKINPTEPADISRLKSRRKDLISKGLTHSLKKLTSKKRKNKDISSISEEPKSSSINTAANGESVSSISKETNRSSKSSDLAAKVLGNVEERSKRPKTELSDNVKSLFTSSSKNGGSAKPRNSEFMTRGFTMPVERR